MSLTGSRVLVLGANGVLGAHISGLLSEAGAHVLGTARSAASSDRLPAGLAERLLLDLADPASIRTFTDWLTTQGPLGGIVNAAGIVGFGTVEQTSAEDAAQVMQVNHLGPAAVIAGALPALRAAAEAGQTPFVTSITGVVAERPFPGMAAYVASKTAHSVWLSALRMETRRQGIRVIDARPGHTETGLATRPRFGTAPTMPTGLAPASVAAMIVDAIMGDATEIPSASFG